MQRKALIIDSASIQLKENRKDFILKLYDQLYDSINRYYTTVWQSVGLLLASLGFFTLVEKQVIDINVCMVLSVLVSAYLIALSIDGNFWFKRNMAVITNIEQLFLQDIDSLMLHKFWRKHSEWSYEYYFVIQALFALCFLLTMLLYHFVTAVIKDFFFSCLPTDISIKLWMPYFIAAIALGFLLKFACIRRNEYQQFLKDSPGYHAIISRGYE